jgi:hypothetical protein
MAGKKKYHKLDDVGIVGKQEKRTSSSQGYHIRKTGTVINAARQEQRKAESKGIRN